jgi:hypothetical protein
MSITKAETVIYSRTHTHKGHAFQVWSYLDDPDPERSTLHFALRVEGETVEGLADRAEAIGKARQRIDRRPAEPGEATLGREAPQTIQGHPPQQEGLALG